MKNFVGLGLGLFVAVLVVMLPVYVMVFGMSFAMALASEFVEAEFIGVFHILIQIVTGVVALVAGSFLGGGICDVALRTARGETTSIGQLFGGGRFFVSFLIAGILFNFVTSIGYLLCFVPGVIAALGLCMYGYCIVDRGMSPVDALKESWRLTTGHKLSLFVFGLLAIVVAIAGVLACVLGLYLVAMPVIVVASAYVYLKLRGEQPKLIGA
jgi:uncharacterized membrane protein